MPEPRPAGDPKLIRLFDEFGGRLISPGGAANLLGVKRQTLNSLGNGKAGISPEMSIRLAKAFGSRPEVWLGMQLDYDLAQANRNAGRIKVQRSGPSHTAA